jgi:hypothetical protein
MVNLHVGDRTAPSKAPTTDNQKFGERDLGFRPPIRRVR